MEQATDSSDPCAPCEHGCHGCCCDECHEERTYGPIREQSRRESQQLLQDFARKSGDGRHIYARANRESVRLHHADCVTLASMQRAPVLMTASEVLTLRTTRATVSCAVCKPHFPEQPSLEMRRLLRFGRIKSGTGWPGGSL